MQRNPGLDVSLSTEQQLNVQLIQTVELIGLSTTQLNEKIRETAESNPMLRVSEPPAVSYSALSDRYSKLNGRSESYTEDSGSEDGPGWIEGMVSRKESLQEHLLGQLGLMRLPEPVRDAAETLITSMDRNGFFLLEPGKYLKEDQREYLDEALSVIHQLDPAGVGALSWRDSLLLQAESKGVKGQEMKILKGLVNDKLELVMSGKTAKAARDLGTDTAEIEALMDFIKTLTPFPGRNYSSDYDSYILPEISIKKDENGKLCLRLADDLLPRLDIDPEYEEMAESLSSDRTEEGRKAKRFFKDKKLEAASLIHQVDTRRTTLEELGVYLMDKQRDFFLSGPLCLKSLTMSEAAEDLGVNDSTISRIASSKYIDTDFGILPIRELFSSKVASEGDENLSKSAVKEIIRQIIEENSSEKKLTDQRISDILAGRGIKVARRTVAKYRAEMDLDSSHNRVK